MPNENAPVCGCGMAVDLPKSRNGALSSRKLTIRIPKSKGSKSDGRSAKKQQEDGRGKSRGSETGSCSSVTEQTRPATKSSKHEKRLNHSRRTRSADRAESHYTYIGRLPAKILIIELWMSITRRSRAVFTGRCIRRKPRPYSTWHRVKSFPPRG